MHERLFVCPPASSGWLQRLSGISLARVKLMPDLGQIAATLGRGAEDEVCLPAAALQVIWLGAIWRSRR